MRGTVLYGPRDVRFEERADPKIDEPTDAGYPNPRQLVQHIAWLKAEAVAPQIDEGILLTADTVAWLDGQVIAKPADEADAPATRAGDRPQQCAGEHREVA